MTELPDPPTGLLSAMRTNGAARAFRPDPVPDAAIWRILDAARFAPSGGNKQGWRVVVAKDTAVRLRLRDLAQLGWREYAAQMQAGVRPFAVDANGRWAGPAIDLAEAAAVPAPWPFIDELHNHPVLLVVAVDVTELAAMDIELERMTFAAGGSIYPFVQNILLAARTEGLAGVMTTFLVRREPEAQQLLGLPRNFAIAALVALGVPEQQPTRLTRRAVADFATIDRFDGPPLSGPADRSRLAT